MINNEKGVEQGSGHKKPLYPRRLDIVDMPSDAYNITGGLRKMLVKTVNYCRAYPAKLDFLREVLKYTLARIDQIQELDKVEEKAKEVEAKKRAEKAKPKEAVKAPIKAPVKAPTKEK